MGGIKQIGDIVETVGDVAKSFNTKEQVSNRHQTDMLADNKLSKNARPIALFWMLGLLTLCIILSCFGVQIPEKFQEAIFWGLSVTLAFYFGGRTFEKYKKGSDKIEEERQKTSAKIERKREKTSEKIERKRRRR